MRVHVRKLAGQGHEQGPGKGRRLVPTDRQDVRRFREHPLDVAHTLVPTLQVTRP